MPSDELFTPTPSAGAVAASADPASTEATGAATAATPPAPVGLSATEVEQRIAAATQPLTAQHTALQRENDALKLAIQRSQEAAPAALSGDDFVASFNKDPRAAIKDVADQASSEGLRQLAPHLQTLIGSANSAFLGAQQTRIETEFGAAAWKEVYQPTLTERFAAIRRENPFAVADIDRVRMEVDLVTGSNFSKLAAMREDHIKGRTTASEAERAALIADARKGITTNLSGGIRPNPKGAVPELDPELRSAIAEMDRHTGEHTNTTEWAQKMVAAQNSTSIDDWLAAQKKPAGARAH